MHTMKKLLSAAVVALLPLAMAVSPAEAEYPERPVTVILPNAAGGAADINLRIIAKHMEKYADQKLIVKNIPGGGTATGTRAAYDAAKDGYTLMFFHQAFMGTAAQGILGRDFRDMTPVARTGGIDIMYVASRSAPFDSLGEMVEHAKANPGEVKVGVFLRANSHIVALSVMDSLGLDFNLVNIPGGGGPIRAALIGEQIDVGISVPGIAKSYIESGELKPLFIFSNITPAALPDLETARDAGFPELEAIGNVTNFFWAHKDVPQEAKDYWADKLEQVMADPELQAELGERIEDLRFARGADLQAEVDAQYALYENIVEKFDLKQ